MRSPRHIHFACNNPSNGMFAFGFDGIWIGTEAQLEGPQVGMAPLPHNRVRIGHCIFTHRGWQEWVGNWCWDALLIDEPDRLVAYLRKRGWQCIEGPAEFFDAFNAGKPVDLCCCDA